MNRFFVYEKTSPTELLKIARTVLTGQPQSEIEKRIAHYITTRKHSDIAGSTVAKEVGAIIAFFRFYRIVIETPKGLSLKPSYEKHRTLEKTEVKGMLSAVSEPYKKAVIQTLAQTGQRLRVLTALSWKAESKRPLAVIKKIDGWGWVTIEAGMRNWFNESFNRSNVHYTFFIHPESMELLDEIREEGENRVFVIHPRHMQEIVVNAAKTAEIQKSVSRRLNGTEWNEVHPDVFRPYWKARMRIAGVEDSDLLRYLTGEKATLAPSQVRLDNLLEVYKKAQASLSLKS